MMRKYKIVGIVLTCTIGFNLLAGNKELFNPPPKGAGKAITVNLAKVSNEHENITAIYNQKYQDKIHSEIQQLKGKQAYSIDNPLVISDPYSTMTNGLYVYFNTSEESQIRYTVSTRDYGSFSGTIYEAGGSNLTTTHESTIIGIAPGTESNITLTEIDADGNELQSVNFEYTATKPIGAYDSVKVPVIHTDDQQELSDGLYTILGQDVAAGDKGKIPFVAMYDNSGVLRCEIPLAGLRAPRLLFQGSDMIFSVDDSHIVSMDKTGYISRIYSLGKYKMDHDYIFGSQYDILILGDDSDPTTVEDLIIDLDLDSGKVTKLDDLKTSFVNY